MSRMSRTLLGGFLALACAPAAAAQEPQDLIVQSTTSVRDSGLLEQVIIPDFQREYPQWQLKVVAVGTGQAIANARAGQGDVLITHAPAQEAQFVADGFSLEPSGRTIMWNDFVIVGPTGDPAGADGRGTQRRGRGLRGDRRRWCAGTGDVRLARRQLRHEHQGEGHLEADDGRALGRGRARRRERLREPLLVHEGGARDGRHAAAHAAVPVRRLLHDHRPRHPAAADRQRRRHRAPDRHGRPRRRCARRPGAHDQPVPRLRARPGEGPRGEDRGRARLPGLPHRARVPAAAAQLPDARRAGLLRRGVPRRRPRARTAPHGLGAPSARVARARSPRRCPARRRSTAPLSGSRGSPRRSPAARSRATPPRTLASSGCAGSPTAARGCS